MCCDTGRHSKLFTYVSEWCSLKFRKSRINFSPEFSLFIWDLSSYNIYNVSHIRILLL